jgi:thiamine-monophosphate kinase
MLRSGAKPGDLVAVTGSFGKSATGLKILLNGFNTTPEMREALVDSVLMPHARLKEGLILSQTKAVTAAIDSSDGLAWSLHELAKASRIGFLIDKFPIAEEAEKFARLNGLDPSGLTLYGGEEYELVLTIKPSLWRKAKKAIEKAGGELLLIGKATSKRQLIIKINGKRNVIEPRGWEHFKNSNV